MGLRIAKESDLEKMLEWRNQEVNRSVMFTSHQISVQEHLSWWKKCSSDTTRLVLIFSHQGVECGVAIFFDINAGLKSAHWGFYLDAVELVKENLMLQAWATLESDVLKYANDVLNLNKLTCQTLEKNKAVLMMHKRFGFIQKRTFDNLLNGESKPTIEMEISFTPHENASDINSIMSESDSNLKRQNFWIFGDANWEIVLPTIISELRSHLGSGCNAVVPSFGEWKNLTFDNRKLDPNCDSVLFAQRIEDFQKNSMGVMSVGELDSITQGIFEYLASVRSFANKYDGEVFLLDFCQLIQIIKRQHDPYRELVQVGNREIDLISSEIANVHVVRYSNAISKVGLIHASPGSFWFLGRSPLSTQGAIELCAEIVRTKNFARSSSIRLVVTDLDDTFWGGTIGEVGASGISIGGDFPGNVFTQYQLFLRELKDNGYALAIASKNTKRNVLDAINSHPEMQLRANDFAAIHVNWNSKAESIMKIARELNIAFENIMFIDDSPYEREEVRSRLPGINVPELSNDPVRRVEQLSSEIRLSIGELTSEDTERANRYTERKQRISEESKFDSRDDYLKSLKTRLSIARMNQYSENRVHQLINKTNQFNFTTKRYTGKELEQIVARGGIVLSISVEDKFSEIEIVGVIILLPNQGSIVIDTFLLSCRVLGRGIEQGVLGWVINYATSIENSRIIGMRTETDRNIPTSGLLEEMGFVQFSADEFIFEIGGNSSDYKYMNGIQVISDV